MEDVGASVLLLHQLGEGAPDALAGFRGVDQLLEFKSGKKQPNRQQQDWHRTWKGRPVKVVRTKEEALRAIGALR